MNNWYKIDDEDEVATPALLVYPDRIEKNILQMIEIAGGVKRLRPHIKTHKTAEIIQMQQRHGIQKYKCATIAEAELLAQCNVEDVLLAMQPVGVNIERFFNLAEKYTKVHFSALVDDLDNAKMISKIAEDRNTKVSLWMDINVGMDRTGIEPDGQAEALFKFLSDAESISAEGLHAYDGHIHNSDFEERKKECDEAFEKVLKLKEKLENGGIPVKEIIAGGSPSFPVHALRKNVDLSPGTTLLWDSGYGNSFKEMKMLPAAVLMTRIISKPTSEVLTSDLGHKSLASEMPFPRVEFLNENNLEQVSQSEEHFVLKSNVAENYKVGDVLYAIPKHICPTVAKYQSLQVVEKGKVVNQWKVVARDQIISI